ncbi:hypothetical protein [Hoeflea sp.]|jgi:hypothetical protein|uniref:hypothetical protein n=1 Tax=Hoeflea sp. TaxID=1940281 RepID=UPI003A93747A
MVINGLTDMLNRVSQARDLDAELYADVISALQNAFPDENFGESGALAARHPTDAALHMVNTHLPGWSITLKGKAHEADGDWSCTLRQSDSRDNDAMIGVGNGPTLALALLVAFLKLNVRRAAQ